MQHILIASTASSLFSNYKLSDILIIVLSVMFVYWEIRKIVNARRSETAQEKASYHEHETKEESVIKRLDIVEEKLASDFQRFQRIERQLDEMDELLHSLQKDFTDVRLDSMKQHILSSAFECANMDIEVTAEYYNSIFALYARYEEILKENNMTNGQCEVAMRIIKDSFSKRIENSRFAELSYLTSQQADEKIKETGINMNSLML